MHSIARTVQLLVLSLLLAFCTASALAAPAAAPPASTERVNVNTADAATIDRVLLNIGPSKAEAIVAYRKANGPFRSLEQLALVKGVGLKTIEKNRGRIVLGAVAARAGAPATAARSAARPAAARAPARSAQR